MKLTDEIKRDATKTGTKLQTEEATEIEQKLNRLFYLDKNIPEELKFLKSVMTRGQETTERKGLHASAVIVSEDRFCYRQQVLSLFYKMEQGEQVKINLKRIFSEGDAIHEKWQRLFIRGGYAKPLDCDFSRFSEQFDLSYTPDIMAEIDGIPCVVEIKSVNTMQFRKMLQHPSGRKQLQLYMSLTGVHDGFVLCEDKNTQDIKVFPYKYNPEEIKEVITRLENIQYYKNRLITKHKMVPRHNKCTSSTCPMAEKCAMRDACWNVGKGRIKL